MGSYLSTGQNHSGSSQAAAAATTSTITMTPDQIFEEQMKMFNTYFGVKEDPIKLQKHQEEYFRIYKKYTDVYKNDKFVVLMLINDFYEMFECECEYDTNLCGSGSSSGCRIGLDDILSITQLKLNEDTDSNSNSNKKVKMSGFPKKCLPKFQNLLLENKYTIVFAEFHYADTSASGSVECEVVNIIKPNTVGYKDYHKISTSSSTNSNSGKITVFVAMPSGVTVRYTDIPRTDTVKHLKKKITHSYNATYPFYLQYHGKRMSSESSTLESYGVQTNHTLEVVRP